MNQLLRKVYSQLNKGLFNNTLPTVEFVPNLQRKRIVHFHPPSMLELGVKCASATREELLDDLLHAMVHVYNWSNGVVDVTRNQYHKIEFCNTALSVGLYVMCHSTRGWGKTCSDKDKVTGKKVRVPLQSKKEKLKQVYSQVTWDSSKYEKFQKSVMTEIQRRPQKQFQFKYVCSCDTPFIIRVGRRPDGDYPLSAKCMRCNTKFTLDKK